MKIEIEGKPQYTKDDHTIKIATNSLKIFIRTIIKEKDIRPTFHLYNGEKRHIYITRWANNKEKMAFTSFMFDECVKLQAHYVIAVSDVWLSRKQTESVDEAKRIIDGRNYIPPSEDPDRIEGLITIIAYPNGKIDGIFAPYMRNRNGYPVFEKNPSWIDYGMTTFNLLKPWGIYQ